MKNAANRVPYVLENPQAGYFRVARETMSCTEILAQEQSRIFDRCWLYVGHSSEIPEPNDFVTRRVGGRDLVFNRDREGNVHIFLNVCPHRGSLVVREKTGKAKSFSCFYHGWAFNNNGGLISRLPEGSYADGFNDDGCLNLVSPRFEEYRGLYFVVFDKDTVSLSSYLAGAKEYIDLVMDHSDVAMEVVGGVQEYSINANWKLLGENSLDGYHAQTTHLTYFAYLQNTSGSMAKLDRDAFRRARSVDLGNGHAVIEYAAPWGRPVARWIAAWGEEGQRDIEAIKARLIERFGLERGRRIAETDRNMLIFPNFVINDIMAITLRTYYPVRPDYMEVTAWALAPKEETEEFRKRRLLNFVEFLGPGGFATPDDIEALELCQRGYRNWREVPWNDISKGMPRSDPGADDEAQMRVFWREWNRYMTGERQ